jgi:hypothetical protein
MKKSNNTTRNKNQSREKWYKKPIGIITVSVIGSSIFFFIKTFVFSHIEPPSSPLPIVKYDRPKLEIIDSYFGENGTCVVSEGFGYDISSDNTMYVSNKQNFQMDADE